MKEFPACAAKINSRCDNGVFETQFAITQHFNPTCLRLLCSVAYFLLLSPSSQALSWPMDLAGVTVKLKDFLSLNM